MEKINERVKKIVETNAVAVATISENNTPHCIAAGFLKVISNNEILITDNYMFQTLKNIANNPNVALAVWSRNWENDDECEGYELRGTAEYMQDGELCEKAKAIPENEGMPCKGVILVKVEQIKRLA